MNNSSKKLKKYAFKDNPPKKQKINVYKFESRIVYIKKNIFIVKKAWGAF